MSKRGVVILAVIAAALPGGVLGADSAGGDATGVLTRPPRGSLAAQLQLKLSLEMVGGGSLAASLDHNRQEWKMLSPDQRERFRRYAVAFLEKSPEEQQKLRKSFWALLSLAKVKREAYGRRDRWVRAVVATFTPEQREELRKMSSAERARALVARRDELVRQGRLKLDDAPTTAPARPAERLKE
jgi:hypothetical protein